MALATVGTDTGGSIRIPAACCGIVGLKPSLGEVSTEGVVPLSSTLDHVGPLAASVADAWTVFRVLTGDLAPRSRSRAAAATALRLAVPRPYFFDMLDDDVRARFEEALEAFRAAGVRVRDIEIPHADDDRERVHPHLAQGGGRVSRGDARDDARALHAAGPSAAGNGTRIQHEEYVRALGGREQLRRDVDAAFADCDALVLPTLPIPAPTIGAETVQVGPTEHRCAT